MPRTLPITVVSDMMAQESTNDPIVLVEITPPGSSEVFRLSSHPTQKLTLDPPTYGTVHLGNEYQFVLMNALVPDDTDSSPQTSLVFENIGADMTAVVRSTTARATVRLLLVFASDPDTIAIEYTGLKAMRAQFDQEKVTVDISRETFLAEPWPAHKQTKTRFPGLFR